MRGRARASAPHSSARPAPGCHRGDRPSTRSVHASGRGWAIVDQADGSADRDDISSRDSLTWNERAKDAGGTDQSKASPLPTEREARPAEDYVMRLPAGVFKRERGAA